MPIHRLSPPGPATASAVPGVPFQSPLTLAGLPVLGTVAALVLAALGAVVAWFFARDGSAPGTASPSSPAAASEVPLDDPIPAADGGRLSADETFVVELLSAHDGRLRQSDIVDRSEWSKSKVSRLLSAMERKGYVEKVTIGRENAIVLSMGTE